MPFRTKIQPIVGDGVAKEAAFPPATRQMPKSRLKRLFERPFSLKNLSIGEKSFSRGDADKFEPTSVCLRKLVRNYMEDPDTEKQWCGGRNSCKNCFSGSGTDSSSDEESSSSSSRFFRRLRNLLLCANISEGERDLVTKTREIVEKNNHDSPLQVVLDELVALGYDAAICKFCWKRSRKTVCPAGEYEYLDVIIGGKRVLIDFDFKSKFEIARPTETYKEISQTLPYVFVGRMRRLKKIVTVISKAAKKSFDKKGLEMPPWRKADHVLTKWSEPYVRTKQTRRQTGFEIRNKK